MSPAAALTAPFKFMSPSDIRLTSPAAAVTAASEASPPASSVTSFPAVTSACVSASPPVSISTSAPAVSVPANTASFPDAISSVPAAALIAAVPFMPLPASIVTWFAPVMVAALSISPASAFKVISRPANVPSCFRFPPARATRSAPKRALTVSFKVMSPKAVS